MATSSAALPEYEVEQKFSLHSTEETETRLKELGFEKAPSPDVHMVDWYWDDAGDRKLTCQDCWLRLRQVVDKKSGWQLKIRRPVASTAAIVYEEIGGSKALAKAMSLLPSEAEGDSQTTEEGTKMLDSFVAETGQEIPEEMKKDGASFLVPFARIETKRSSWTPSSSCQNPDLVNIKVDLDLAIYGPDDAVYAVGEVEEVVHREDDIADAKERVEKIIVQLTTNQLGDDKTPMGKLEHYLMQHRPHHYQALVDSGILK